MATCELLAYPELPRVFLKSGFQGKRIYNEELLRRSICLALVHLPVRITASEFRFFRIELGKTQKEIAQLFGKDAQSVLLWENGKNPVPLLADKAIRDQYCDEIRADRHQFFLQNMANAGDLQLNRIQLCYADYPKPIWAYDYIF